MSPSSDGHRRGEGPLSPRTLTRSHRCPSPMISSSIDPDEVSSSEEGVASEAAVTASEVEDKSDLEDGMLVLSQVPDLSPILEDGGKHGASRSSISRSSVLSPKATVLVCQDAIDVDGRDLVSSLSSSLLDADVRGDCGCPDLAGAVLGVDTGALADVEDGDALTVDGGLVDCGEALGVKDTLDRPPTQTEDGVFLYATVTVGHSQPPLRCDTTSNVGGGSVSEEVSSAPLAREAVRPQPTDGLR
ncbi:hypothetical protein Dimus_001139 [Dionaea muscipula]